MASPARVHSVESLEDSSNLVAKLGELLNGSRSSIESVQPRGVTEFTTRIEAPRGAGIAGKGSNRKGSSSDSGKTVSGSVGSRKTGAAVVHHQGRRVRIDSERSNPKGTRSNGLRRETIAVPVEREVDNPSLSGGSRKSLCLGKTRSVEHYPHNHPNRRHCLPRWAKRTHRIAQEA